MELAGKVSIGSYPLVYPIPVVLVGANVDGAANYEAIGNCAIAGFSPGLVVVSSVRSHYTNQGIRENGTFSVNFPTAAMREAADFCGLVSGREYDKASLFENFYGSLGTAPMIAECPVNLECRVVHTYEYESGGMEIFVGLVVNAFVDRQYAQPDAAGGQWRFNGAPLAELAPLVYHLDNRYYEAGAAIGRGFHDGKGVECPRRREP